MKRISLFLLVIVLLGSCQSDITDIALETGDKASMDQYILESIQESQEPFDWNQVNDLMLWQALDMTDRTLVIGYGDGVLNTVSARNSILEKVYALEGLSTDRIGETDEVLLYKDDVLGFMMVKISSMETMQAVRQMSEVSFVEVNDYQIELETIRTFTGVGQPDTDPGMDQPQRRDMILDPQQSDPDYPDQVDAYDDGLGEVVQRHRVDEVYRTYGIYGEDIGIAVIDNGMVDWAIDLFTSNGYGGRELLGFYNPLWFFPWTQPDGVSPQPSDVFGISELFEGQWLHGSGMIQSAFVMAPNADIVSCRASTAIIILSPSQILGISNAFRAMADRDDIKITNMSMGTIFYLHRIKNAINYYYSKGKIIACASGTTPEEIKELLGIIFPANLPNTVAVTGIRNREGTDGAFEAGSTAHFGPENDFCVEASAASSEATARMVGFFGLLWSADPSMSREEVMDIMIQSSYFYNEAGQRDEDFGWGTVDMMEAVGMVLD